MNESFPKPVPQENEAEMPAASHERDGETIARFTETVIGLIESSDIETDTKAELTKMVQNDEIAASAEGARDFMQEVLNAVDDYIKKIDPDLLSPRRGREPLERTEAGGSPFTQEATALLVLRQEVLEALDAEFKNTK